MLGVLCLCIHLMNMCNSGLMIGDRKLVFDSHETIAWEFTMQTVVL